jgi:hypothetical protein
MSWVLRYDHPWVRGRYFLRHFRGSGCVVAQACIFAYATRFETEEVALVCRAEHVACAGELTPVPEADVLLDRAAGAPRWGTVTVDGHAIPYSSVMLRLGGG